MAEALNVIMRFLHISSVAALIGGVLYGRLVLWPGLARAGEAARKPVEEATASAFRPVVFTAMGLLTLSGLYNILSNPGHSPRYHMILGIKLLLALHVFAAALMITRPKNERRARVMTGTAISGLIIIAISAYLRRIF